MKTKLTLTLLVVGLVGCQQKSEIDKCVDAVVNATSKGLSEQDKAMNIALARLDCLKAQAGGK